MEIISRNNGFFFIFVFNEYSIGYWIKKRLILIIVLIYSWLTPCLQLHNPKYY